MKSHTHSNYRELRSCWTHSVLLISFEIQVRLFQYLNTKSYRKLFYRKTLEILKDPRTMVSICNHIYHKRRWSSTVEWSKECFIALTDEFILILPFPVDWFGCSGFVPKSLQLQAKSSFIRSIPFSIEYYTRFGSSDNAIVLCL